LSCLSVSKAQVLPNQTVVGQPAFRPAVKELGAACSLFHCQNM
jgi:hypothetical protein